MTRRLASALALGLCLVLTPTWAFALQCRASHYGHGDGFHGRITANGETFSKYAMTAAMRGHRGRRFTVTNLANGRSVRVRINDYGPAEWTGKCIDLSPAAFSRLAPLTAGVVRVRLSLVQWK